MADRFTLDASDWPLIINDGDDVVATFPLNENDNPSNDCRQVERANAVVRFLNERDREAGR